MAEEFKGKVTFIGVSNNDTVEDGRRYQTELEVPYPLAHAPQVWELFGISLRPTTIVLGPTGSEEMVVTGPITLESLRTTLVRLTSGSG